jgi:hypothetical protein
MTRNPSASCDGWQVYSRPYPDRAQWLVTTLQDIRQHPVCRAQFPEAVCDYVTAGFLVEQANQNKNWFVPCAGRTQGQNHVWLYDPDAQLHIDFTAHQFFALKNILSGSSLSDTPARDGQSPQPVMVLSTKQLDNYGYVMAVSENGQIDIPAAIRCGQQVTWNAKAEYMSCRETKKS